MELISVVIPMYGKWDMVNSRLWEIYEYCLPWVGKLEIVICEDFSGEDFSKRLKWWRKSGTFPEDSVRFFCQDQNVGFGSNANYGLEKAEGDLKILVSSDVILDGNFISPIYMHLLENERDLVGAKYLDFDTGWNKFGDRLFPYLEGFLLAGRKEFWDDIQFDPIYGKYDYEDVDLSTQALEKGYNLTQLSLPVRHIGGATINSIQGADGRRKQTEKNKDVFREKWIDNNENSS